MNATEATTTFVPKQAHAPTPALYNELVGDCMEQLAKVTLSQAPPIPSGSLIHDNGCGVGAASAAVIESVGKDTSSNLSFIATDIVDGALEMYRAQAAQKGWPATTLNMDSTALKFDDNKFTHSFGNALLFVLPDDGIAAMKEMHRTLKPGGTMLVNYWAKIPTLDPVQIASIKTRPAGTPVPRQGAYKGAERAYLRSIIEQAGFSSDKIEIYEKDVYATSQLSLERFSALLWSFVGGTSTTGWLEQDETRWDEAVGIVAEELGKSDGFWETDGSRCRFKFVANVAIATK